MDMNLLFMGLFIFIARICDVSIGTLRTIFTVQGRTVFAFFFAVFEVTIWITVISTVIYTVRDKPLLIVFYAFGYATGNVVGIMVERKLAFGLIILRVISRDAGKSLAARLREIGQPVTVFTGEGMKGPVDELYIVCRRKDLRWILPEVKTRAPEAFYVIEQARDVSKVLRPTYAPIGGWRAVEKRK